MKITELQRQKVIDVLEDLAEDAAYESSHVFSTQQELFTLNSR